MAHEAQQAIGGYLLGLRSQNLLRQERHQVSGMTHRDDFELTGLTERVTQLEDKMTGVYPIDAKLINHGSTESIQASNRRSHWRKRGTVCQHDPRDVDVLVKDLRLEQDNFPTPATHDVTQEEPDL